MLKFVVLYAFVAVASADPGLYSLPLTQYSTIVNPATTTIGKEASTVIHQTPVGYYGAAPFAYTHFIKKRSPQIPLGYIAPSTYIAPTSYVAPASYLASTPLVSNEAILPAVSPIAPAVHLIKKRSAPLLPTTYIAPHAYTAATSPILTTYGSTPLISSTQLISQPLAYSHLIKKRSAPLFNTYLAPSAYSTQTRINLQSTPLASVPYNTPIAYTSPLTYQNIL